MLPIILQLLAIATLVALVATRGRLAGRRRLLWLLPPALLAGSLWTTGSSFVVQKWLGRLFMPLGVLWLLLLVAALTLLWRGRGRAASAVLGFWVLFWLSSSNWLGQALLTRLERDHLTPPEDPAQPYEAVLLLGGGTMSRPWGEPQLSPSGDRVATAARLYHRGLTARIVTSGSAAAGLHQSGERSLADETKVILRELGVPAAAIILLPGPRNTSEEIPALAKRVADEGWTRVALVTSAWHMPRALGLAQRAGLRAVPIAADHRSGEAQANIVELMASAAGAAHVRLAAWEQLGMLVGR